MSNIKELIVSMSVEGELFEDIASNSKSVAIRSPVAITKDFFLTLHPLITQSVNMLYSPLVYTYLHNLVESHESSLARERSLKVLNSIEETLGTTYDSLANLLIESTSLDGKKFDFSFTIGDGDDKCVFYFTIQFENLINEIINGCLLTR